MSSKNLSGVRVAHDLQDFIEDHEIVLTLKDQEILGDSGLNDDGDVLENIQMARDYKTQVAIKNRNRKLGLEPADDDSEKKTILPQYDEPKFEKDGFVLDSHGEYSQDRLQKAENIKFMLSKKKSNLESLETTKNIQSEYMTEEEVPFRMPKKKNLKKKAREDIIKFLEENLEHSSEDLGSRQSRQTAEDVALGDVIDKKQKMDNYNNALDKARVQTKQSKIQMDDGYDEVERAIENTRRMMQKRENTVDSVIKNLLDSNQKVEFQLKSKDAENPSVKPTVKEDMKENGEKLEFISMDTDFLKNISTEDQINENQTKISAPTQLSLRDSRDGTASIVQVSLPSDRLRAYNKNPNGLKSAIPPTPVSKVDVSNKLEEETPKEEAENGETTNKDDDDKLKEEVSFVEEEALGKGMFSALRTLRDRGLLNKTQDISGRAKDKTYEEELKKFGPDKSEAVKLEYRDEKGRLMTPKEAFRYQCYIFHGKKPSKNKQEKRRVKEEQAKKSKTVNPDQSVLMRALNKNQQNTNQSHLVLSNSSKY